MAEEVAMYLLACRCHGDLLALTPDLEHVRTTLQGMFDEGDESFDGLALYAVKRIPLKGKMLGKIPAVPKGMTAVYFRVFEAHETVDDCPDKAALVRSLMCEDEEDANLGSVWVGVRVTITTRVEVAQEITDHRATSWVGSQAKTTRRKKA